MVAFKMNFNSIPTVQKFANNASLRCDFDIDLISGRYVINGKSVLGIFSLDLSKPIEVRCHCNKDDVKYLIDGIEDCLVSDIVQS